MSVRLTVDNFFRFFAFNPHSKNLAQQDRPKAWAATIALFLLTAGTGHIISRLFFFDRKVAVLDPKKNPIDPVGRKAMQNNQNTKPVPVGKSTSKQEVSSSNSLKTQAILTEEEEEAQWQKEMQATFASNLEKAEQGDPAAMLAVEEAYHWGRGTKMDYKKAFEWTLKLAQLGYPGQMEDLARAYDCKPDLIATDKEKAIDWYIRAGNARPSYDSVKKESAFRHAADLGSAEAMLLLAKNTNDAQKWFVKAAQEGNQEAIDKCNNKGWYFRQF